MGGGKEQLSSSAPQQKFDGMMHVCDERVPLELRR